MAGKTCVATATTGVCEFQQLDPGNYIVEEVTAPTGHELASPSYQAAVVGNQAGGATVNLTFINPRLFTVITLVCKESNSSLYSSSITHEKNDQSTSDTANSISAVPTALSDKGVTQAELCGTGGARFTGRKAAGSSLGFTGVFDSSTTIGAAAQTP